MNPTLLTQYKANFFFDVLDSGAVVVRVAAEVDKVDGDDVTDGNHGKDGEDHEATLVPPRKARASSAPPLIFVVLDEMASVPRANLGVGVRTGHFGFGTLGGPF